MKHNAFKLTAQSLYNIITSERLLKSHEGRRIEKKYIDCGGNLHWIEDGKSKCFSIKKLMKLYDGNSYEICSYDDGNGKKKFEIIIFEEIKE